MTSRKYYLPYIARFKRLERGMNVLEVGCGEGGNLLPFAETGCNVTGVDLSENRIKDAIRFFAGQQTQGTFIASDIFLLKGLEHSFDLILCHDVIEHIGRKAAFLSGLKHYLKPGGIVFMSFPAWQMPFGGHQQICRNKVISHLPFIHLLPSPVYKGILKAGGETQARIEELLSIKQTRTPIELFEKLAKQEFTLADRRLYFINPHYEVKFGLKPRRLPAPIASIPYVRNFFTTSCFYLLK